MATIPGTPAIPQPVKQINSCATNRVYKKLCIYMQPMFSALLSFTIFHWPEKVFDETELVIKEVAICGRKNEQETTDYYIVKETLTSPEA